jgi:uncharacterized PurR-regulated membrane protein YhhQ (DUF165 family)
MAMQSAHGVPFTSTPTSASITGGERPHRAAFAAAVLLALILLALSAVFHAAAAATLGGGWQSLSAVWAIALAVAVLAIVRARNGKNACGRMCFVNGVASVGVLIVGTVEEIGPGALPNLMPPFGPVFRFAVASGVIVLVGSILALVFFAGWYLLSRHARGSTRHA